MSRREGPKQLASPAQAARPPRLIPRPCVLAADSHGAEVGSGGQDGGGAGVRPALQVAGTALPPALCQQHLPERTALSGAAPGAAGSAEQRHPL